VVGLLVAVWWRMSARRPAVDGLAGGADAQQELGPPFARPSSVVSRRSSCSMLTVPSPFISLNGH
jgi:hypothetical protein